MTPADKLLSARRKQFEIREIPVEYRQFFNIGLTELNVYVRPISLELRNLARHFDGLCYGAHLKLSVYLGGGVRGNLQSRNVISFKPRRLHVDLVVIGNQVRDRVIPTFVRRGLKNRGLCNRGNRHLCSYNRVPLRVCYGANNAAENRLTRSRGCA